MREPQSMTLEDILRPEPDTATTVLRRASRAAEHPLVQDAFSLLDLDPFGMMRLIGKDNHPFGITQAIVGQTLDTILSTDDDIGKARAIYDWITKNVAYDKEKGARPRIPPYRNANETYADKQGVCVELAYLYTAMARIAGLPCKKVTVTVNNRGEQVSHACAAVMAEGRQILVDPAYHLFDAQHKRYVTLPDDQAVQEYRTWKQGPIRPARTWTPSTPTYYPPFGSTDGRQPSRLLPALVIALALGVAGFGLYKGGLVVGDFWRAQVRMDEICGPYNQLTFDECTREVTRRDAMKAAGLTGAYGRPPDAGTPNGESESGR